MSEIKDRTQYATATAIVRRVAMDMREDYDSIKARCYVWAISGIKKLYRENRFSKKRYAILTVNKALRNVVLPEDCREITFIGYIDGNGMRVPIHPNNEIVNTPFIPEYGCDIACDSGCVGCYPKSICNDLEKVFSKEAIAIEGGIYYKEIKRTILSSGEYFEETRTPYWDTENTRIAYHEEERYITKFDVEKCGCIKTTEENKECLKRVSYDTYCCYCSSVCDNYKLIGYKVFWETGTLSFDNTINFDKLYIEYTGCIPKVGNEFVVPEIAIESIIEYVKWCSVRDNKSIDRGTKRDYFERWKMESENLDIVKNRINFYDIINALAI